MLYFVIYKKAIVALCHILLVGFLPPPPDAPTFIDQTTALGEPTMASLGLGGYWPSGIVQSLLENIHVYTDLPWFGSIIASE